MTHQLFASYYEANFRTEQKNAEIYYCIKY